MNATAAPVMTTPAVRRSDVEIHPTAVVADDAELGPGVRVGPFAVIGAGVRIGSGTWIASHAVVGAPPMGRSYPPDRAGGLHIGSDCVIRESVMVQHGSERPTLVGDRVYVMSHSVIGHDAEIGDDVMITVGCMVSGFARIEEGANLGLGVAVHQHRCVGAYAIVGMQAAVTRDVPPALTVVGVPAVAVGVNRVGLQRAGMPVSVIAEVEAAFRDGRTPDPALLPPRLAAAYARRAAARDTDGG
jgi:UDP-N-acetylglucosamine acyltransferase